MDTATTGNDLIEHWNYAADKGLMNRNTAYSYRSACSKVLSVIDGWESVDITTIDIDDTIARFKNLRAKNYKPKSLEVYAARFRKAVESYLKFISDPSSWKPKSKQTSNSNHEGATSSKSRTPQNTTETSASQTVSVNRGLIDYPFPLRDGVTVRLQLPRDITISEVKRLQAFMTTLATDFEE